MKNNIIVNIGRQYASGGLIVGDKLSQKLGFSFYDKNLIDIASRESGLAKEFFEEADEKNKRGFFSGFLGMRSSIVTDYYSSNYLSSEALFKIQSDIIRELAEKQSCVFVGRCADYILRENPNSVNIFITASPEDRVKRLMERENAILETDKAVDQLEKIDKKRAGYYNYYTNKTWGAASSYHLCVNTTPLGIDGTVEYIYDFLKRRFGNKIN